MDGSVFGPQKRKRIAFLAKFGEAGLGRRKTGLGRSKTGHFHDKGVQTREAKACLDRTGASGSLFLLSYGNCRASAGNYIKPEGKAYVKDKTYD